MQVIRERFEDASEQDAEGLYEYYYSGIIYRFVFPTRVLVARWYDDSRGEASFLRPERPGGRAGPLFPGIPYQDAEFREAVAFLRGSEGVETVNVLLAEGYARVDFGRLAG